MRFGVRDICDVVFKAKTECDIGSMHCVAGQPVLYIDSAKTSTMEGAATTVYAQGGKGNARLVAWEGERTLTFTVEDALLSPMGFALLSGAGLFKAGADRTVHVHTTSRAVVSKPAGGEAGTVDLKEVLGSDKIDTSSPIFVMAMDKDSITEFIGTNVAVATDGQSFTMPSADYNGKQVFVDFYVAKNEGAYELTIDMENFAGYFYVEASTLFRREADGKDLPAELIFPNVKIQSNFTFSMAATGDPSTFTFTMDAMPGYTRFDHSKKVLCAIQIVDEDITEDTPDDKDSAGLWAEDYLEYPLETVTE